MGYNRLTFFSANKNTLAVKKGKWFQRQQGKKVPHLPSLKLRRSEISKYLQYDLDNNKQVKHIYSEEPNNLRPMAMHTFSILWLKVVEAM